ncbi:MAG: hypothetical protein KC657_26010 [Myxococcales bacterium]|nr:hypothetical protein [Myxococcales bacterium]
MIPVRVSVTMGGKVIALEKVRDVRVAGPLWEAGQNVARQLSSLKCPEHGKGPTDVRLHFDASGNGDLKYESCCEALGKLIARSL